MANRCPVTYPAEAVDGYELVWWTVEYHGSTIEVLPQRAVYKRSAIC